MSIYSVLRHRCRVERYKEVAYPGGGGSYFSWATAAEDVPCLLDAQTAELNAQYTTAQQQAADRAGKLLAAPDSVIRPGDRVVGTRGFMGRFEVKPDPAVISTLMAVSHREYRVNEVPLK